MKRPMVGLALAGLMMNALLASPLRAQDRMHTQMHGDGMDCPMCSMMSAQDWQSRLGLTDEQTQKLKAAIDERQAAVKPLAADLRQDMDKLDQQVKSKASDQDIRATMDRIEKTRQSLMAAQDRFRTTTDSFLTPTQHAKMMLEMRSKMGGMGRGRQGGARGTGRQGSSQESGTGTR